MPLASAFGNSCWIDWFHSRNVELIGLRLFQQYDWRCDWMLEDDGFGIDNDLGSSEQLLIATEAPEMSNNYEVISNNFDGGNGWPEKAGVSEECLGRQDYSWKPKC